VSDSTDSPAADARPTSRWLVLLGHLGADATVALVWAALIIAIVLFSGVVSQFAYVDF
jgi:hypothetical protein